MGDIGKDHDVITLKLGGDEVRVCDSYEVVQSIIQQPCAFSLRLGTGDQAKALIKKYPAGTAFTLEIDGTLQITGTTDGYITEGSVGGTEFTLRGRDRLKSLMDAYVEEERSWTDATYREMTNDILGVTVAGDWWLGSTDAANRKAISRAPVSETRLERVAAQIANGEVAGLLSQSDAAGVLGGATGTGEDQQAGALLGVSAETAFVGSAGAIGGLLQGALLTASKPTANQKTLQAKLGERWFAGILKPQLDRTGLMLWCTGDGNFILSTPATDGRPVARLYRKRGGLTNVKRASFRNESTGRYARCVVHFRQGGGASSRGRGYGVFHDEEMIALGFTQAMTIKDAKCKTLAQADFLARKKIAESRRAGWSYEVTVAGHTTMGLDGRRIVWSPNTVIEVDDDENGIREELYVEQVSHSRRAATESTLRLMRKADVVFGEEL